jgi:hypothetical protein
MIEELTKDQATGMFRDSEGCHHESRGSFICDQFGFCGCGKPEEALDYVRQALQVVSDLKNLVWTKKETYEAWSHRSEQLFKSDGAEYFMWYRLDNLELIEHGGQVPGWLTEKGERLLEDLKRDDLWITAAK